MTTYQTTSMLSEVRDADRLSLKTLGYFRARLRNRLHQLVLNEFVKQTNAKGFTKAALGRRIRRGDDQVNRWLGAPGNWTLDTVSDLLLSLGYELSVELSSFEKMNSSNNIYEEVPQPEGPINEQSRWQAEAVA